MAAETAAQGRGPDKLWNINFIMLLGINILTYMAFNLVSPLLAQYATDLGASVGLAGTVVGLFAITALIIGPFSGIITDRTNKKVLMIIATFINGLATLGYSLAPNMGLMIFFRILHGASFSFTITSNLAWISDYIPERRMGEGIGYFGIAQIIATAFGPQLGIMASHQFGTSRAFLFAAILQILAAISMNFVSSNYSKTPKPQKAAKRGKIALRDIIAVEVLPLSLIGGLFSVGNGLVSSFLVLLGEERGIAGIGIYFTINALFLLFTRPIAGKLYDQKGLSIILFPALILSGLESLLIGHAHVLWMIMLAAVVKAFGQGTAQPALQAESLRKLGHHKKGLASSTFYIGANLGQGLGPMLGGAVASRFGYTGMFNLSALLMLLGLVSYAVFMKNRD